MNTAIKLHPLSALSFSPSLIYDSVGDLNVCVHLGWGKEWLKTKPTKLICYSNTDSHSALQLQLALQNSSNCFCNSSITFLTSFIYSVVLFLLLNCML